MAVDAHEPATTVAFPEPPWNDVRVFLAAVARGSDAELQRVTDVPEEVSEDVFLVMHARTRRRREVVKVADALRTLFRREPKAHEGRI